MLKSHPAKRPLILHLSERSEAGLRAELRRG
jgi:hypothetical protein